MFPPADHDPDAANGVAKYDPFNDVYDASNPYAVPPGPTPARDDPNPPPANAGSTSTTADNTPAATSFVDSTGVRTRHASTSGVVNAHAGTATNRTRSTQSKPYAYRKPS